MKKVFIIGAIVLLILVGAFVMQEILKQQKIAKINSFDECAAAGFPILTSYPEQCKVPNGKSFTQDIGNEMEYSDEMLVDNPRPNQSVASPLVIQGKARGNWFFEGSFPAELFDENNVPLGTVALTAEGEWMTEEFVPFTGEISFLKPKTSTGKLIIKNDNPSGLPENEKKLEIPVKFEPQS